MGLTSDDDDDVIIMMMMTYVSMYVCIMAASGLKGTALPIDKTQTTFRKTRSIRTLSERIAGDWSCVRGAFCSHGWLRTSSTLRRLSGSTFNNLKWKE